MGGKSVPYKNVCVNHTHQIMLEMFCTSLCWHQRFLDERDDSYIELLPLFFLVFSWFGILNTSISGEMSQHLMSVPSKYVPQLKKDSGNVVLDRVFLDGDQLTEQSAHNENVLAMFNGFLGW